MFKLAGDLLVHSRLRQDELEFRVHFQYMSPYNSRRPRFMKIQVAEMQLRSHFPIQAFHGWRIAWTASSKILLYPVGNHSFDVDGAAQKRCRMGFAIFLSPFFNFVQYSSFTRVFAFWILAPPPPIKTKSFIFMAFLDILRAFFATHLLSES